VKIREICGKKMTLNELFQFLGTHPAYTITYLIAIPAVAGILGILIDDKGGRDPWRYIYMFLLYLIAIPGIFALTLLIYSFLFERTSVYDIDLITHVLPILSMAATIWLIRRSVNLDLIPGFGKLTGLIMMITTVLVLLWILDKTRLILFSYLPFPYVFLILIALLVIFRLGLKKVF
jgi:hypothetical protein